MSLKILGDVYLDKIYNSDITLEDFIFNLEYPLSINGIPAKNKINLGSSASYIQETFSKFPLAVTLANNHIMDYGEDAFISTINYLEKNDIAYFGAGNESNNYNNPAIVTIDNVNYALLGYSCRTTNAVFGNTKDNGSALLDEKKIINDINLSKLQVDKVIVILHWGDEYIKYPKPSDVIIARNLIDAGADIIVGHHAHIIQSNEIYKGKHIFYGIGNAIFPNFSVNSKYNGDIFEEIYTSKWSENNNRSIIISIDGNKGVSYLTTIFENGLLKLDPVGLPLWIPKSTRVYNLYRKYVFKMRTVNRFLKNPKFPSSMQIKLFFGFNS